MQDGSATMEVLREGDAGADVVQLQTRLQAVGFPPGAADGAFGPGTLAALLAFQKSENLLPDGVAGPATLAALGFPQAVLPPLPGMPPITVAMAVQMFPGALEENIAANLPLVMKALEAASLTPVPVVLAALATIRAETAGFVPLEEFVSSFNTSPNGKPFDLYDNRRDLGNRGPTDGADYRGRGFIQLTGRDNYLHFGKLVGLPDLADTPDQANDPTVAAALLAAFVSAVQVQLRQALAANDLATARRLVNGGTNGLDDFIAAYQTGTKLLAA
jgi:peptidoglycan L-alanyl-D-glutamate endopeptidase CwlK